MKTKKIIQRNLFSLLLSLSCFIFALAIFELKGIIFGIENYGFVVRCFYLASGMIFMGMIYFIFQWKEREQSLHCTFKFRKSCVIINVIGLLLSPILLIAYFFSNFPKDVFEGVLFPAELIGSVVWLLFLNFISVCFFSLVSFCKIKNNKEKLKCRIFICTMATILCIIILHHFYNGRYDVAMPEMMLLYSMLPMIFSVNKNIQSLKTKDNELKGL